MSTSRMTPSRKRIERAADDVADQADQLIRQGARAIADRADQVRGRAVAVGDDAVERIRREPVTAVMVAAASGALLAGIAGLVSRARR